MITFWYLWNAEKTARKKLKEHEEYKDPDWDYDMFGEPLHSFADSMTTAMGLMVTMCIEFAFCLLADMILVGGVLLLLDNLP